MALVTAGLLIVRGVAPAQAHAVDLFPVDDWIGDGLKSIGKIALGPLKLGAEAIAKLLGAIVAALADLLIPKSLIDAGVNAIKWLVQLPPLGTDPVAGAGAVSARMPHLRELRDTLTWIGLTLLPLQLVVAGGRSLLSPTADGDSPTDVLQRTIAAALGLIAFDWLWGALTELVRLITTTLLSLPWVADGVRRMLQSLVIGGAGGTAVAAEFVVPLLLAVAGAVLLALMLLRVGLEVIAALVYATGGIALGLSVSGAGARLLQAWMVAATAVFVLPVIWCVVFVCGAALMLDAGGADSDGGFGGFIAQLYNIGAALVTFGIAIKLARAILGHAGAAMTGLALASRFSSGGGRGLALATAGGGQGTPQSLTRFSQRVRGGLGTAAAGVARAGTFPVRHPVQTAAYARHPVRTAQSTGRDGPSRRSDLAPAPGAPGELPESQPVGRHQNETKRSGARTRRDQVPAPASREERPQSRSASRRVPATRGPAIPAEPRTPQPPAVPAVRPGQRSSPGADAPTTAPAAPPPPPIGDARAPVRRTASTKAATAWRATRRVVAPTSSAKKSNPKRKRKQP